MTEFAESKVQENVPLRLGGEGIGSRYDTNGGMRHRKNRVGETIVVLGQGEKPTLRDLVNDPRRGNPARGQPPKTGAGPSNFPYFAVVGS